MRLDRAAAQFGLTRAEAKRAIAAGRVRVDGAPARDAAMQVDPARVSVAGMEPPVTGEIYLMVNKPAGVVTATEDPRWPTVSELLPEALRRRGPGPVGRLDRDVTGLVLMTTDGQLAHRLISPKWKAEKVYRAACAGRLGEAEVAAFAAGIALSDFTAQPALLSVLRASPEESLAEVTLTEGKFHQVKRMFAAAGHPLTRLERVRIGCVALDESLESGGWRALTAEEISGLKALCGLEERKP